LLEEVGEGGDEITPAELQELLETRIGFPIRPTRKSSS